MLLFGLPLIAPWRAADFCRIGQADGATTVGPSRCRGETLRRTSLALPDQDRLWGPTILPDAPGSGESQPLPEYAQLGTGACRKFAAKHPA